MGKAVLPLEALREGGTFPVSSGFWWLLESWGLLGLWKRHFNPCLCLHVAFPWCVSVSLHIVLIRAADIGFRATLIQCDLIVTNYIRKDPISNLTRSDTPGGREFLGGHLFNP